MSTREAPRQPAPPPAGKMRPVQSPVAYPADKARGAALDLQKPWQKLVFFGGLIGIVVLVLALRFAA